MVFPKHQDRTSDNVSCNRVVLAPKTKTKTDPMTEAQSMKLTEMVTDYPIAEKDKLRNIKKTKKQ